MVLDPSSKVRSFALLTDNGLKVMAAFHSNQVVMYKVEEEAQSMHTVFGDLSSHKLPIRSVQMSANDHLFATSSFDSVKVWTVDLFLN